MTMAAEGPRLHPKTSPDGLPASREIRRATKYLPEFRAPVSAYPGLFPQLSNTPTGQSVYTCSPGKCLVSKNNTRRGTLQPGLRLLRPLLLLLLLLLLALRQLERYISVGQSRVLCNTG